MAAFHISRAFAHQRDQVALLTEHRSQVNAFQMTMRITLFDHLQVLTTRLHLFARGWAAFVTVFRHQAIHFDYGLVNANSPVGNCRGRVIRMPSLFQRLEDFDTGLSFIFPDASGCPEAAIHIHHRKLPDFAFLIFRARFFSPDIGPQCIQLAALDFKITHLHRFDLLDMRCRFSQPFQNRIFFVPFGAGQTADAIAFG